MMRGSQVELGGIRVDRPMWGRSDGAGNDTEGDATEPSELIDAGPGRNPIVEQARRLPRMRSLAEPDVEPYRPDARTGPSPVVSTPIEGERPPVDVDLTSGDPWRRPVDIDLTEPVKTVDRARSGGALTGRIVAASASPEWSARFPSSREFVEPEPDAGAESTSDTDLAELLRISNDAGSPYRVPTSTAGHARRHRWLNRRARRIKRRLRTPRTAQKLERRTAGFTLIAAALAVLCTVAFGARSKIHNEAEFLDIASSLHKDPAVADSVSRQTANALAASDVIDPADALQVKLLIEYAIQSDEFGPAWRSTLSSAHDRAFGSGGGSPLKFDEAVPELTPTLVGMGLADETSMKNASLASVQAQYVAELSATVTLLDRVLMVGLPSFVAATFLALRRTRNRYRAAGLLSVTAVLGAAFVMLMAPSLAESVVSFAVDGPARTLAMAAMGGILPSVRVMLFGLVIVAGTLAVASRLEEVRLTPLVPSGGRASRHQRKRKRQQKRQRRAVSRPDRGPLVLDGPRV